MKKRFINNKGFSLVELIVVIAIMAILIGVLAPNLLRFIGRADISADIQVADNIRSAITTAIMDPMVETGKPTAGSTITLNGTGFDQEFGEAVAASLNYSEDSAGLTAFKAGILGEFRTGSGGANSDAATDISATIDANMKVVVTIVDTEDEDGNNIVVGN